jgi:UDP-N-acetylmuramoyl-tripeptide--D-alanyl-D-alanine ligase
MYLQAMRQTRGRRVAVIEIGIGQPNQMRRYARAVRPDVVVVTTIGWEHEKYFPDGLDGIEAEKAELVRALPAHGVAVLNRDDERVMRMADKTRARKVTFGRNSDADVVLAAVQPKGDGTRVVLRISGAEHAVNTRLIGAVSALPITAAFAAAYATGISIEHAISRLEALAPTLRRLEPAVLPRGALALLDDNKGTPATAIAAFETVRELPARRRFAVLGKIPKTTPEPKGPVYDALGRFAGGVFDRIIFVHLDDAAYETYRRAAIEAGTDAAAISRARDVVEAARELDNEVREGDVVLLKGHSTDHLSRIVLRLRGMDVRCRTATCAIKGPDWCDVCPLLSRATG